MKVLEMKHIKKSFGELEVLKDISLEVKEGEVVAIIGPSGSGKSTLLRCATELETADSGEITYLEGNCTEKCFGLVFQNFNLFPQYTALQNVTLARELMSKETGESQDTIVKAGKELLEQMGLADRANHYPHQLSGGQQQRVAIARALAMHPDILCFDEPTSALDPELTGEVLRVIRNLAEQRTTMIIVTHEMAFARDVADQLIFMDQGFIVEQGDPHQVIDHPREERTRHFLAHYSET